MWDSNHYFLTHIQVSQVMWFGISISLRIFQFVMIHTVKGFSIVNESEVDVFLELPCLLCHPKDLDDLISGSSAFSKHSMYIWKLLVHHCWSLAWRILSITFVACKMSTIIQYFEHSLALPFFGIRVKTDLFWSCGHCWVFQICWHTECSTLTASSFSI